MEFENATTTDAVTDSDGVTVFEVKTSETKSTTGITTTSDLITTMNARITPNQESTSRNTTSTRGFIDVTVLEVSTEEATELLDPLTSSSTTVPNFAEALTNVSEEVLSNSSSFSARNENVFEAALNSTVSVRQTTLSVLGIKMFPLFHP